MDNVEFANALRAIAAHYEEHPEMPQPFPTLSIYCWERQKFIEAAVELAKGGKVTKSVDGPDKIGADYHATRDFGGVAVDVRIGRSTVCRLVSPAVYECPDSLLEEAAEYSEAAR